jgi:DNA-binding response OmpR family regulator
MKILLVEDDIHLGESISAALEAAAHVVDWVGNRRQAENVLAGGSYRAVLLDIGLPDGNGLKVVADMRRLTPDTPILVISARDEIRDRVVALDAGADDFLVKPFDLRELLARTRVATRRRPAARGSRIELGLLLIDLSAHQVLIDGRVVQLRTREYQILVTLATRLNQVVSRRELEEAVSPRDQSVESNTIEVFIHHLRRKLGNKLIETVRGAGYVIRA